jgi:hypothetical protein
MQLRSWDRGTSKPVQSVLRFLWAREVRLEAVGNNVVVITGRSAARELPGTQLFWWWASKQGGRCRVLPWSLSYLTARPWYRVSQRVPLEPNYDARCDLRVWLLASCCPHLILPLEYFILNLPELARVLGTAALFYELGLVLVFVSRSALYSDYAGARCCVIIGLDRSSNVIHLDLMSIRIPPWS